MTTDQDSFRDRVHRAVLAGNQAGGALPHPTRGRVGYQGAGPDPVQRFCDELTAAGGLPHVVADPAGAAACVIELVRRHQGRRVFIGQGAFIDRLGLEQRLGSLGLEVVTAEAGRDAFFAADIGISGVDALIAETGTIVQVSRPGQPRSLSLLPPVYIAVAHRSQLLPDLFDWFETIPAEARARDLAACYSLITGPSKTGDIELRLVTGVHGPGEVHVILVNG
jgi:L-lactate dehydrogenase complex protein LldG